MRNWPEYKKIESHLREGDAFVGMAYHEDKPIAAVNYGIHKDKAVYWTGACYEMAYQLGANHFLHWEMIQKLYNNGICFLDMGEFFKSIFEKN